MGVAQAMQVAAVGCSGCELAHSWNVRGISVTSTHGGEASRHAGPTLEVEVNIIELHGDRWCHNRHLGPHSARGLAVDCAPLVGSGTR